MKEDITKTIEKNVIASLYRSNPSNAFEFDLNKKISQYFEEKFNEPINLSSSKPAVFLLTTPGAGFLQSYKDILEQVTYDLGLSTKPINYPYAIKNNETKNIKPRVNEVILEDHHIYQETIMREFAYKNKEKDKKSHKIISIYVHDMVSNEDIKSILKENENSFILFIQNCVVNKENIAKAQNLIKDTPVEFMVHDSMKLTDCVFSNFEKIQKKNTQISQKSFHF